MIAYTIDEALKTPELEQVILATEDEKIALVAKSYGVQVITLPPELSREATEHTALHVLGQLAREEYHPDAVAILPPNSPFRRADHITEAINTMMLFEVDSVISVCQDLKSHYQHGPWGLAPLLGEKRLRLEKDTLYEGNSAICLSRVEVISQEGLLGNKIGHILMSREDSLHIASELDFWAAEGRLRNETG